MPSELEAPHDWGELYLARGEDVADERPVFTGDVFTRRPLAEGQASEAVGPSQLLVLQHPCALRINGVDLVPRILVAEVEPAPLLSTEQWKGSFKLMPLPGLLEAVGGDSGHRAGKFNQILVVTPEDLAAYDRVACLSEVGVNLLLQRWVHHNSRVIVPTHLFAEVTAGPSAEAELTEDWVSERVTQGADPAAAEHECHDFLRSQLSADGPTRQDALRDPQRRSEVRRAARAQLALPMLPA